MIGLDWILGVVRNPSALIELAKNPAVEAIATAGISTLAAGVILVYVVRSLMPLTPFLYANARIQAGSSKRISSNRMKELAELKSLDELENALRESDYGEELEKIKKNDLRSMHAAIEKGFGRSLEELRETSPDRFKRIADAYIMFLEANVLQAIYRAKFFGSRLSEELVFSIGNISPVALKHLIEAETVSDMGVVMSSTLYRGVFYKKYDNAEDFDVAIEEFVLNNLIETIKKTKMYEAVHITDVINKKVDILNLLALIKLRIRNIDKDKQLRYVVKNRTELAGRFKDIIFADTLPNFVEAAKGLPYHEALTKAMLLYEKDGSLFHFENELQRFFKSYASDLDMAHTLGPYPLMSCLIKKEIEKRNLFIVSKGIDSGFGAGRIKEMVI